MTERIATRERCGICHRISAVGFWVPNEVWAAVVHHSRLHDIHCLACFADHADAAMVDWAAEIKFYPVSLVSHLRGDDPSERGMLDPSAGSAPADRELNDAMTVAYEQGREDERANIGQTWTYFRCKRCGKVEAPLEVEPGDVGTPTAECPCFMGPDWEPVIVGRRLPSAAGPGDDKCPADCTDPLPSACRNGTVNSPCRCAICHGHIPGFSTVDMAGFVYDCPRCSPLFGVCVKHRFSPGDNELKSGEQGGMGEPGAIRTAPDVAGTTESQDGGVSSARPAVPASPSLSSPDAGDACTCGGGPFHHGPGCPAGPQIAPATDDLRENVVFAIYRYLSDGSTTGKERAEYQKRAENIVNDLWPF